MRITSKPNASDPICLPGGIEWPTLWPPSRHCPLHPPVNCIRIDTVAGSRLLGSNLKRHLPRALCAGLAFLGPLALCSLADPSVIVSATANPDYTQRKYGGENTRPESYVVMQGHYFEGSIVDGSIDRMPFRHIAEIFAPELARRKYWPAKNAKEADLLIVVHWGTTSPHVSTVEMMARTSLVPDVSVARENKQIMAEAAAASGDIAMSIMAEGPSREANDLLQMEALNQLSDQITNDLSSTNAAQLLGYTKNLRKMGQQLMSSAEEHTLRLDLSQMRYFIILKAYNLHAATRAERGRAVWTLHLNMSSPGNNFHTALARMSVAAVDFVGRTTDEVQTIRQPVRETHVEIGPLLILGEVK